MRDRDRECWHSGVKACISKVRPVNADHKIVGSSADNFDIASGNKIAAVQGGVVRRHCARPRACVFLLCLRTTQTRSQQHTTDCCSRARLRDSGQKKRAGQGWGSLGWLSLCARWLAENPLGSYIACASPTDVWTFESGARSVIYDAG